MKHLKWLGVAAGLLLVISCFIPWVFIPSHEITVTGVNASGTNFGVPAYIHFILAVPFLLLTLIKKIWAKRFNLLVVALNTGWMLRNFIVISLCRGGECPERQGGIYLMAIASILMLISALMPDMTNKKY
jgi:hypothetical protein